MSKISKSNIRSKIKEIVSEVVETMNDKILSEQYKSSVEALRSISNSFDTMKNNTIDTFDRIIHYIDTSSDNDRTKLEKIKRILGEWSESLK